MYLGIISNTTKSLGYNAIFAMDHTATSIHEIGGVVVDHIVFDEQTPAHPDFMQWSWATWNSPTSYGTAEDALVTSPVNTGASSLHLHATGGTGGGEEMFWIRRGTELPRRRQHPQVRRPPNADLRRLGRLRVCLNRR